MDNPYSGPTSEIATKEVPRKFGLLFWMIAGVAAFFSLMLGIVGTYVVPAYAAVYASFGTDVPWFTLIVLHTEYWWWLALVVTLGLWAFGLFAPARLQYRTQLMLAFATLGFASMLLAVVALMALYLPIRCMCSVV